MFAHHSIAGAMPFVTLTSEFTMLIAMSVCLMIAEGGHSQIPYDVGLSQIFVIKLCDCWWGFLACHRCTTSR
jgi:hypothetical protein